MDSHHGRQTGSSSQHGETYIWIITVHEHTKSSDTSSCHTDVQRVLDGEVQGSRGKESLKLSEGCQRSCKGDATNKGSSIDGSLVYISRWITCKMRLIHQIRSN